MSVLELNGRVFDASTTGTLTLTSEGGAATTDVTQGLVKCWANCDFSVSSILQNSFNVSSFADGGTGLPELNFTSNFVSAKYCLSATHDVYSERAGAIESSDDRGNTSLVCKPRVNDTGGAAEDSREVMMSIVGDLA